jgi:hypothetical protein
MPTSRFPTAFEMRRLKFGASSTPAEKDAMAHGLRAAGRIEEAVLLYEGRADHPDLAADRDLAIREGMAFLVLAMRKMGAKIDETHLRACAASAEAKGRWLDAHRCYTALADAEALARIAPNLPGFKVAVPANKV